MAKKHGNDVYRQTQRAENNMIERIDMQKIRDKADRFDLSIMARLLCTAPGRIVVYTLGIR